MRLKCQNQTVDRQEFKEINVWRISFYSNQQTKKMEPKSKESPVDPMAVVPAISGGSSGGKPSMGPGLVACDFVLSFMWVWSGVLIKLLVYHVLGLGLQPHGEILKGTLSVISMFVFAWLGHVTRGASYNPLTILASAMSGNFPCFLFTVLWRIPAQVIGSIIGVKLIVEFFPEVGGGPRLNVDIHQGALTEGLLTFIIVMVLLGLRRNDPKSFFMKTWISSISKLTLHILGSDLTGGCMNPASAFGWAFSRGDHITKEHLFVYWLAPLEATLLGVWAFSLLENPRRRNCYKRKQTKRKNQNDLE